ncbi:MAG TPA: ABC transporter substrate-binding protein [Prochlorococcus sp.]|nr:ABC transporter substrate-binding protein [Prochlorococcus sp.]
MSGAMLEQRQLGRRELLKLGLMAGLMGLASCGRASAAPLLRATPETLPKKWRRSLPVPWSYQPIEVDAGSNPFTAALEQGNDLLALGDGWLTSLPEKTLQRIEAPGLQDRLDDQARAFEASLGPALQSRVLPVGVSPWVLLFRQGDPWALQARSGWQVLLDPALKGRVVLPQSPRLVMSLAERMQVADGLRQLRAQAYTFDDRQGLNWLIQGKARVAVLPLQRCLPSLRRDPRLSVVLPNSGAPLNWTVLVRSALTREPLPQQWVEQSWQEPLLGQLLAGGWIPPLPRAELRLALRAIPKAYQSIVLPSKEVWSRCWSLPVLTAVQQIELDQRWSESTP